MHREFLPFHMPDIGEAEVQAVVDTLRSGWLTTGPKVKQFEEEFAQYVGCRHAVAVNSGTAALHLALAAVGIKEEDEVLVPTMTFAATAEVVLYFHAWPVLVDCQRDTFRKGDFTKDESGHSGPLRWSSLRHGEDPGDCWNLQPDDHRGCCPRPSCSLWGEDGRDDRRYHLLLFLCNHDNHNR